MADKKRLETLRGPPAARGGNAAVRSVTVTTTGKAAAAAASVTAAAPKKMAPVFRPVVAVKTQDPGAPASSAAASSVSDAHNRRERSDRFTDRHRDARGRGGGRFGRGSSSGSNRGGAGTWRSVRPHPATTPGVPSTSAAAEDPHTKAALEAQEASARVAARPQYSEEDMAPTAASMKVDPKNPFHPITLPFMNPHSFRKLIGDADGDSKGDQTWASSATDDGHARERPAESLFLSDDGNYVGQDQIFFIQLPTSLPTHQIGSSSAPTPATAPSSAATNIIKDDMDVDMKDEVPSVGQPTSGAPRVPAKPGEVDDILGFRSTLSTLPSGKIGKLLLYKSGKARLVLGSVAYDVSTGMACNFLQEAVAIDSNKLYQIGDISKRMVCFPVVDDLLTASDPDTVVLDD